MKLSEDRVEARDSSFKDNGHARGGLVMSWNDGEWNWVIWVYQIDGLKYLFEQGASPLDIWH